MKQSHDLTAPTPFSANLSWPGSFRAGCRSVTLRRTRLAERLHRCLPLLTSAAAALGIGGLFLAGSYLFFIQLAEYGW